MYSIDLFHLSFLFKNFLKNYYNANVAETDIHTHVYDDHVTSHKLNMCTENDEISIGCGVSGVRLLCSCFAVNFNLFAHHVTVEQTLIIR